MDEEEGNEYRWESGYEKTWEAIKEDDDGLIDSAVADIIQKSKRKRQEERMQNARLGMMRHLILVLDGSDSMLDQDLKPTRHLCTLKIIEGFIEEYIDQNPISQLGIIVTRDKRATMISELGGNAKKHIAALKEHFGNQSSLSGEPSLMNSLNLAINSLHMLPAHTSREVVFIMASLTTCDPGGIHFTIQNAVETQLCCSVIALSAEVYVFKKLCQMTGGKFNIILDDKHFRDIVYQFVEPLTVSQQKEASLVKMGFPHHLNIDEKEAGSTLCACHLDSQKPPATIGYFCPQCHSKYCELPVECSVCELVLVSALHFAKSYRHLFPIPPFKQLNVQETSASCFACAKLLKSQDKYIYECQRCKNLYCLDCDVFIHDSMHLCPGCVSDQNLLTTQIDSPPNPS
ncbi:unnamed protein product [Bemisia tabaci]|uniref:General transcription factor IIH subunit n=1 Tax=Bemisia tabaci TaxID=7038 RepID=A0A9P0F190_BEMTA|nr:unnamed protein product [Bemisia tabaci]